MIWNLLIQLGTVLFLGTMLFGLVFFIALYVKYLFNLFLDWYKPQSKVTRLIVLYGITIIGIAIFGLFATQ